MYLQNNLISALKSACSNITPGYDALHQYPSSKVHYISAKEPYIFAKDPHISTKEPCISATELHRMVHCTSMPPSKCPAYSRQKRLYLPKTLTYGALRLYAPSAESLKYSQKSPVNSQKSHLYPQKSRVHVQKSPTLWRAAPVGQVCVYPQKSPIYPQKSHTYLQTSCILWRTLPVFFLNIA